MTRAQVWAGLTGLCRTTHKTEMNGRYPYFSTVLSQGEMKWGRCVSFRRRGVLTKLEGNALIDLWGLVVFLSEKEI